jgi:hypothetical protein
MEKYRGTTNITKEFYVPLISSVMPESVKKNWAKPFFKVYIHKTLLSCVPLRMFT